MTTVALVGCAHIHTPKFVTMLRDRRDITVAAVWDHDPARAAMNAALLETTSVPDVTSIWADDDIEAVIICSETVRHPGLVRAALAASKHLFVEKPLATTGSEAHELATAIEASGLIFSTGFFMRGQGVHRYLRDQIAEGGFGKLTRIDVSVAHAGALAGWFDTEWRWITDSAQSGYGALGDLGIHGVDLILWLLGFDVSPARVNAWTGTVSGRYGTIDEFGHGQLAFPDGLVGSVWASWADLANPQQLVISGTKGHASVIDGRLTYRRGAGGAAETVAVDLPADRPHAFELFLDAISGDASAALVKPSETATCSTIIEALYASVPLT